MPISESQLREWALEGLRHRIADAKAILADLEREEKELRRTIGSLPVINGTPQGIPPLEGKTKREAAEAALRAIGQPARMPQIIRQLREWGYGKGINPKKLPNAIYVAMDRAKEQQFTKNGYFWGLTEWREAKEKTP